ncbi:putative flavin-containing monooxygenase [Helianthus annuus]|uniref:Flavin-containing monooxygenase n=2 Tax=Helianthus annuus TaxID=4232 RepID=A0A251V361_HELAN|nr:putative flavin-containing monooxygenase [Helianthus annuus]KAJ0495598.1 putative flavin-containing monooxygenase [Helianthus annuus]KAJ0606298.1 putative flavin-containing monooxygenase [Helianthus annuus]KAJ0766392.1 putative flavin-containing monooxygenase [Helianthus annuus]KAJ0933579.1 putative flavin-containing monooxygenase [Helianthus annuus]
MWKFKYKYHHLPQPFKCTHHISFSLTSQYIHIYTLLLMAVIFSKIGILGGGISGLAAAKQLAEYNPVVLEATDSIGGVWKHCSFRTTKLQTPRCDYEFSDYPWPLRDNSSFPSYTEILEYLNSYATHFDLFKFIKFNSRVVEIKLATHDHKSSSNLLSQKPFWEVAVQTIDASIQWYSFEFIVVCMGKYGDIPIIPKFGKKKGPEVFKGKVMHSQEYSKLNAEESCQLLKGKKVVVVGYKKSAIDLAVECAQANQGEEGKPCTMVVRTSHWIVPHYSIWGLPFYLFYSTRFSQFLHQRPNQGTLRTMLCTLLSPARKATSKMIESYLLWKLPLVKYGLKPDHPFEEDYASCQMAILPESFFPEADKGRINFKRASSWWFWEDGVAFDDGTKIEADLVILATGFDGKKKLRAVLPQPFSAFLEFPSGIMPLYRGTINPYIPNMAFMGYVESVSNLHTSEIRCKWLARLIGGKFKLPSMEKMVEQIKTEAEIMKKTTRFYKRTCISTFSINHSDEICEEMGWTSWRKKTWLAEAFSPYNSQDYQQQDDDDDETN